MRWVSVFSIFGLLVLLLIMGTVASADNPEQGVHRLLVAEDLSPFGDVYTMIPESPFEKGKATGPGALAGWEEARSTSMLVSSRKPGEYAAIVTNRSYKFLTPEAAQAALRAVQDPGQAFSWVTRPEDASLPDQTRRQSLAGRSSGWCVWHGTDNEGLPAYALWIQFGSYISEVQVTVGIGQETFGHRLFNHIIGRLIADPPKRQATVPSPPSPSPEWWWAGSRAYRIEDAGNWEYLAVWSHPYGYGPHYWGIGGDGTTCQFGGEHGCISNWVWWLLSPESKLGLPKTFLIGAAWSGDWDANNYSATVWME